MSADVDRVEAAPGPMTFTEKFRHLWLTRLRPATDSEHAREVAKAMGDTSIERQMVPLTKAEIAAGTGLTPAAIGYLLSGRSKDPSRKTMQLLADFYKIPVGELASNGPIWTDTTRSVADRINAVVAAIRPGGGDVEYTDAQLATFASCTEAEIRGLRDGSLTSISLAAVQRLAAAFGVSVGYIVDGVDAQTIDPRIALLDELRDGGAIRRALHSLQVGEEHQQQVLAELVATLMRVETVPAVPVQSDRDAAPGPTGKGVEDVQFRSVAGAAGGSQSRHAKR